MQRSTNPKQMYIKAKLDGCAPNVFAADCYSLEISQAPALKKIRNIRTYQIIVADAADAVSVNFSGRCKFLPI